MVQCLAVYTYHKVYASSYNIYIVVYNCSDRHACTDIFEESTLINMELEEKSEP